MNAPNCYVTRTLPVLLNMSRGAGMNVYNAPLMATRNMHAGVT
jgi:hypothetical protein